VRRAFAARALTALCVSIPSIASVKNILLKSIQYRLRVLFIAHHALFADFARSSLVDASIRYNDLLRKSRSKPILSYEFFHANCFEVRLRPRILACLTLFPLGSVAVSFLSSRLIVGCAPLPLSPRPAGRYSRGAAIDYAL
jgi:hypothetical protein